MSHILKFLKNIGYILALILLTILATTLFLGGIGTFYLYGTSNWNAIPIFIESGFIFATLFFWIKYLGKNYDTKRKAKKTWLKIITILSLIFLIIAVLTYVMIALIGIRGHEFSIATEGYEFDTNTWVFKENISDTADFFIFWNQKPQRTQEEKTLFVIDYFDKISREKSLIRKWEGEGILNSKEFEKIKSLAKYKNQHSREVENILSNQVESVLREESLVNPANSWQKTFMFVPIMGIDSKKLPDWFTKTVGNITPVNFRLENKRNILIIAHREQLEEYARIMLISDLDSDTREEIEKKVDEMGFSSITFGLGGVGTYPTTVIAGSLHGTISTIAHEWVHNYINFQKLGKIKRTTEQRVIEETTATILGREIRDRVWEKYYEPYADTPKYKSSSKDTRIDFNEAMREIRQKVEKLLANGKIEEAENYMRERRDWLETEGHYVRKLNQAYFAFRSFYATNPTFQDANGGIGAKLLELREKTSSLKKFLNIVSNIKNLEDLEKALEKLTNHNT